MRYCGASSDDGSRFSAATSPHPGLAKSLFAGVAPISIIPGYVFIVTTVGRPGSCISRRATAIACRSVHYIAGHSSTSPAPNQIAPTVLQSTAAAFPHAGLARLFFAEVSPIESVPGRPVKISGLRALSCGVTGWARAVISHYVRGVTRTI